MPSLASFSCAFSLLALSDAALPIEPIAVLALAAPLPLPLPLTGAKALALSSLPSATPGSFSVPSSRVASANQSQNPHQNTQHR